MDEEQQQQVLDDAEAESAGVVDITVEPNLETGEVKIVDSKEPTEVPTNIEPNYDS